MIDDKIKQDKADKPGGVNFWSDDDIRYLFANCKGYSTIPSIAKALGRTELAVARRVALAMSSRDGMGKQGKINERQACIMHSLDLMRSGGRFDDKKPKKKAKVKRISCSPRNKA